MRWGFCMLLPVWTMLAAPVAADTLLIEEVEAARTWNLPGNGLTQSEVGERWGQPHSTAPAVGDPPITRWSYADFVVYFEYDRVITTVLRHEALAGNR